MKDSTCLPREATLEILVQLEQCELLLLLLLLFPSTKLLVLRLPIIIQLKYNLVEILWILLLLLFPSTILLSWTLLLLDIITTTITLSTSLSLLLASHQERFSGSQNSKPQREFRESYISSSASQEDFKFPVVAQTSSYFLNFQNENDNNLF